MRLPEWRPEIPPVGVTLVFVVLGILALWVGLALLILGEPLPGASSVAIGVLFLVRSWRWLKLWTEQDG